MAAHETHEMHPHSLKAYWEGKAELSKRSKAVLAAFRIHGSPVSDREIMKYLGFDDMNCVRPRITELCKSGHLEETEKIVCPVTGKKVRECKTKSVTSS